MTALGVERHASVDAESASFQLHKFDFYNCTNAVTTEHFVQTRTLEEPNKFSCQSPRYTNRALLMSGKQEGHAACYIWDVTDGYNVTACFSNH